MYFLFFFVCNCFVVHTLQLHCIDTSCVINNSCVFLSLTVKESCVHSVWKIVFTSCWSEIWGKLRCFRHSLFCLFTQSIYQCTLRYVFFFSLLFPSSFIRHVSVLSRAFPLLTGETQTLCLICKSHFHPAYCQIPAEISLSTAGNRRRGKKKNLEI